MAYFVYFNLTLPSVKCEVTPRYCMNLSHYLIARLQAKKRFAKKNGSRSDNEHVPPLNMLRHNNGFAG